MIPPDVLDKIRESVERIEMELMGREVGEELELKNVRFGETDPLDAMDEIDGTDEIGRFRGKICVRRLFGLCNCEGYRECFVPATIFDRLVFLSLLKLKDDVDWEVLERAKRIWVDRERERFKPLEVALELLSMAGRELESERMEKGGRGKAKRKARITPAEWRVYI